MEINQWLDTDLGRDIWNNKYRHNNETLDEWFVRVSGGNKKVEKLIREKKFMFGGRATTNRGTGNNASYSNCYSHGYLPDSLSGIMEVSKDLALTYKSQGGQGVSLSKIRPKDTPVGNGSFVSDGIVPFMEIMNTTTKSVSQGGSRKGALMMSLSCEHKQIMDFITIKSNEGMIEKANLSVEVSDDFMNAVDKYYANNDVIELEYKKNYEGHIIEYSLKPIEIYKAMMEQAYDWAEPGIIYTENFRNYNLMQFIKAYEIVTGNPCFTGEMRLLTSDGYKTFEELDGKDVYVVNSHGDISLGKVWETGVKDTVTLKLSNGSHINCTPNHRFMLNDNSECEAKDSKGKRIKRFIGGTNENTGLFFKLGFIQGDGALGRLGSDSHKGLEVFIGEKDDELLDVFNAIPAQESRSDRYYVVGYNEKLKELGFSEKKLPNRVFPSHYSNFKRQEKLDFLKGCYSANGCVIKGERVAYKTTCKEFSEQLVEALAEFGISAYITVNKAKVVSFSNGDYECKESYDVNIAKIAHVLKFYNNIGFIQKYKIKDLVELLNKKSPAVISIKDNGKRKVYDFSEPIKHWGVVEGLIAHNCGEQPLPEDGACCLGSLNLSEFVEDGKFIYDEFNEAVLTAIEALNEVLDEGIDLHALPNQRKMAEDYRNIGLGIMGIGDMFIKMKIAYGSDESKEVLDTIMNEMFRQAVIASRGLAVKHDSFPKYEESVYDSDIIKAHFDEDEIKWLKEGGIRNCSLLSIAPTGSIGTMLDITTGIEPAFAWSYQRKTESLHKDEDVYYTVWMGIAKKYLEVSGEKTLPNYFVESGDIKWKDRIDVQAIAQKHIDTAISATVNLPKEISMEEVEHLYLYAWKQGLKGITIFRDGCKKGAILSKDSNREESNPDTEMQDLPWGTTIAPSDDMIGRKRSIMTGCGRTHIQAWFDPIDGRMMEVFLAKGSSGGCNSYMLGLSRMTSLALRTGANFEAVIDQLSSTPTCPSYAVRSATKRDTSKGNCCPTALGNSLKEMQKEVFDLLDTDEEHVYPIKAEREIKEVHTHTEPKKNTSSVKCPECGGDLIFEGGCNSCRSCGFSKCE